MDWLVKSKKSNYQGNYKFHLVISQDAIDSSSTVSIMAFTDSSQKAVVPCSYNWFIIKNGVPQEIPDFRGSSFICETGHIGYLVQAHITSNDPEYPGKAIVTLGPVELDVTLKIDILASLSQGYSNQAVYLINQEHQQRECTIQIYEDKIRIMHAYSDLSYTFDYSMMQPLFSHNPKEVSQLSINFNEKYESDLKKFQRRLFGKEEHSMTRSTIRNNSSSSSQSLKLDLRFLSRANRDVFLYTLKGFITKRQLKNSIAIHKIQKINFDKNQEFNTILLVNELRRDLVRYDRAYKKLAGERKRLEEQGFGSSQSIKSSSMRREEPQIAGKVIQLEKQNQLLNNRIRALMQEVNNIRLANSPPPPSAITNFKKKRQYEDHTISHLLEDLNRSEQMVHFDADNHLTVQRLQSEKRVLQMNLDHANQKISFIQKRSVNFSVGSIPVEKQLYDRMTTQNQDLKRANDRLQRQVRLSKDTIQQLRSQTQRKPLSKSNDPYLQRELDDVRSRLSFCEHELQATTKSKQVFEQKYLNLTRKVAELQNETEMYRRNQDVMNRSQTLSEQMFDYNEEQVKLLKEHNEFLVAQNEKLAKACEKYMSEAKQAIKLRQEILALREKLSKAYTNPENQSFTA